MSVPGPVIFNYETWVARYPEFDGVPDKLAQLYFNEATLYYNNCGWSAALPQAPMLLNMLTAHIAQLNAPLGGQPSPQTVGRISNATEGSVNVTLEMGDANSSSPNQAWYEQTKYGAAFWAATAGFRTARYRVRRCRPGPYPFGYGAYPWGGIV